MRKGTDSSIWGFIDAFRHQWLAAMSGSASVPFTILAVYLPNKWGQTIFALAAVTCALFAAFRLWKSERDEVNRLQALLAATIKLLNLGVFADGGGEQYIRVLIKNTSGKKLTGLKARLVGVETDQVTPPESAIDFPIQLFTQERLKERIAGGDAFVRPFNLDRDEERAIEIFQTTNPFSPMVHIYDLHGRRDWLEPLRMDFKCEVVGGGPVLAFSVRYVRVDVHGSMDLQLLDTAGREVDKKEHRFVQ